MLLFTYSAAAKQCVESNRAVRRYSKVTAVATGAECELHAMRTTRARRPKYLGVADEGRPAAAQHRRQAGRRRHAGAARALVPRRRGEAARRVAGLSRPHLHAPKRAAKPSERSPCYRKLQA